VVTVQYSGTPLAIDFRGFGPGVALRLCVLHNQNMDLYSDYAHVRIATDTVSPIHSPSAAPTATPTSAAPTGGPTAAPTIATAVPSAGPTAEHHAVHEGRRRALVREGHAGDALHRGGRHRDGVAGLHRAVV